MIENLNVMLKENKKNVLKKYNTIMIDKLCDDDSNCDHSDHEK
jgi:hypothetical protein